MPTELVPKTFLEALSRREAKIKASPPRQYGIIIATPYKKDVLTRSASSFQKALICSIAFFSSR